MAYDFAKVADRINVLQDKIDLEEAKVAAKLKDDKAEVKQLEEELLAAMQDAEMKTFKGKNSVVDVTESLRVSFKDFEAFATFMYRKKLAHLFERRISTKAYAEIKESLGGKEVPGLSEFNQARIKVKKAK